MGVVGGIDQMSQCVACLQKKSVSWCIGEGRHWGDGISDNGVMLEIFDKCGYGSDHPVEQE